MFGLAVIRDVVKKGRAERKRNRRGGGVEERN